MKAKTIILNVIVLVMLLALAGSVVACGFKTNGFKAWGNDLPTVNEPSNDDLDGSLEELPTEPTPDDGVNNPILPEPDDGDDTTIEPTPDEDVETPDVTPLKGQPFAVEENILTEDLVIELPDNVYTPYIANYDYYGEFEFGSQFLLDVTLDDVRFSYAYVVRNSPKEGIYSVSYYLHRTGSRFYYYFTLDSFLIMIELNSAFDFNLGETVYKENSVSIQVQAYNENGLGKSIIIHTMGVMNPFVVTENDYLNGDCDAIASSGSSIYGSCWSFSQPTRLTYRDLNTNEILTLDANISTYPHPDGLDFYVVDITFVLKEFEDGSCIKLFISLTYLMLPDPENPDDIIGTVVEGSGWSLAVDGTLDDTSQINYEFISIGLIN